MCIYYIYLLTIIIIISEVIGSSMHKTMNNYYASLNSDDLILLSPLFTHKM